MALSTEPCIEPRPIIKKYTIFARYQVKLFVILQIIYFKIWEIVSQILKTKFYVFWTQTCRNWAELFTRTCNFSQVSRALKTMY